MAEPWLRGTLTEVDALRRQVLHALELAAEDTAKWCEGLTDAEINLRPFDLAPVAFHLRHIARSLDRLLTYAEGRQLAEPQMMALRCELHGEASTAAALSELQDGLANAARRVMAFSHDSYEDPRGVGRKLLPATVAGLLIHCAEHTQRHVGQAITTAKVVVAMRA